MKTSANLTSSRLKVLIRRTGRVIALSGVLLPLLLIGGLKFTAFEAQALVPLVSGAPWLAWIYSVFGHAGTSYLLGLFEIIAALLLLAAPWSARAATIGGGMAGLIFLTTSSLLLTVPLWEAGAGGFPALSGVGQFLIKDIALLGISVTVVGESMLKRGDPGPSD